jgi:hypothetical protein
MDVHPPLPSEAVAQVMADAGASRSKAVPSTCHRGRIMKTTYETEKRLIILTKPLNNPSYDGRSRNGPEAIKTFAVGTIIAVSPGRDEFDTPRGALVRDADGYLNLLPSKVMREVRMLNPDQWTRYEPVTAREIIAVEDWTGSTISSKSSSTK